MGTNKMEIGYMGTTLFVVGGLPDGFTFRICPEDSPQPLDITPGPPNGNSTGGTVWAKRLIDPATVPTAPVPVPVPTAPAPDPDPSTGPETAPRGKRKGPRVRKVKVAGRKRGNPLGLHSHNAQTCNCTYHKRKRESGDK